MKRSMSLVAIAGCALLTSCKGMKIVTDDSGTRVEAAPAAAEGGAEDRHWIRSDEVFIAYHDAYTTDCFEVTPARMLEEASEATKGQAKVFELRGGKERWTGHVYRSRPAEAADLKNGVKVIFFKGPMAGGKSHGAPPSKGDARPGGDAWFCSTVSDASDLFKGEVRVAGYDYGAKVEALRVVLP